MNVEAFVRVKTGAVEVKALRAIIADRGTCRSIEGRISEAITVVDGTSESTLVRYQALLRICSIS